MYSGRERQIEKESTYKSQSMQNMEAKAGGSKESIWREGTIQTRGERVKGLL